MSTPTRLLPLVILTLTSASASAQHAQVSAVAVNPNNAAEVWSANRDNNSVAVVDTQVGASPRRSRWG